MKKLMYVAILALGVVVMMTPPVMAQDEKPFTIHGEARFRGEYDANAQDFNDDGGADNYSYWPYRLRLAAEGKFTKGITAWIEFQNGGVFGNQGFTERLGSDLTGGQSAELYQGNLSIDKLWWKGFSVRIGRQEMVAGTELMLGDLDFYQGRSFDALTGNYKMKKGNVMLFYSRVAQGKTDLFTPGFLPPDQVGTFGPSFVYNVNFMGVYTNWDIGMGTLDAYLLNLKDHDSPSDVMTLGARWGKDVSGKNGLYWNIEYAMQSGDADSTPGFEESAEGDVAEGWIGWNFKSGKNNHRVYARLGMASGDDSTTADYEGFIPMFGDFHNRLGHGDFFQLSGAPTGLGGGLLLDDGITGTALGWNGMFGDRHELGAELWSFTSEQENAAGEDKLGSEIDFWYSFNYSKNLIFSASLSQLSPDDGLTGGAGAPDDSVTRLYGNARLRF